MIDFGLSKGQLELAGMVCAAALVAIPFLKWALGGIRRQVGHLSISTVVVLSLCTVHSMIVGGTKTNGINNLPPQQMMQGGSFLTGLTGLTGLSGELFHGPSSSNLVNLVNPVQNSFAERMARNWNIRGACGDSLWLDFEDGFVFPEGTNHLEGVEVLASGEVWRTPFDTNAVATIGAAVSIVPGLSSFAYEHTSSNSYRFVWTDAAINRDTNNLVSASLELFRNGDVYSLMSYAPTNGSIRSFWVGAITNGTPLAFTMQRQKSVFIGKSASSRAFAHELGHVLGLADIYVRRKIGGAVRDLPCARHSVCKDFFGDQVCDWGAESDCGFYPKSDGFASIISALLMHGTDEPGSDNVADIPSGPVFGYGREPRNVFSATNVIVGVQGIVE